MDRLTKWFVIGFFVFLWLQIPAQIRSDIVNATFGALFAGLGTTVSTTAATAAPYTSRPVTEDASVGSIIIAFGLAGVLYFALRGKILTGGGSGQRPSGGGGERPRQQEGGGQRSSGGGGRPQSSGYKQYLPYAIFAIAAVVFVATPTGRQMIANVNVSDLVNQARSLIP